MQNALVFGIIFGFLLGVTVTSTIVLIAGALGG